MKMDFPVQSQLQTQSQKIFQHLMMSPHMQQAIKVMQLPVVELASEIEQQVAQNPVIEISDEAAPSEIENDESSQGEQDTEQEIQIDEHNFDILKCLDDEFRDYFAESESFQPKQSQEDEKKKAYVDSLITSSESMYESLLTQAQESFSNPKQIEMAKAIIGNLNDHGYFETPLQEIAVLHQFNLKELEIVWEAIKMFDPPGIAASSIKEALLIQLKAQKKEDSFAYVLIRDHYDDLIHNRIPLIQKKTGCLAEDIQRAIHIEIARLDIRPGMQFANVQLQEIHPDVTLRQDGECLIAEANRDDLPNIRLNNRYLRMLSDTSIPNETKNYIREHILSAKWLMRAIQQRQSTIERIADFLGSKQKEYLIDPNGKLLPLTMKTVAEELNLHESTVARAVANKYIHTPRGVQSLRSFFTSNLTSQKGEFLSSNTVRDMIFDIIQNENKQFPLSDQLISNLLKEKGIICARRTIAKYRVELHIGNAQQRKKFTDLS